MIGNDVVDLELANRQTNWRREGYLDKVFTPLEQNFITTSTSPARAVWILWSMKEAAYKAHQRQFQLPRRLNWLAQECSISYLSNSKASGIVKISGETYYTSSEITSAFIHTWCETISNSGVKNGIFEASASEVKNELKNLVSEYFNVKTAELELLKDLNGIPFLRGKDTFFFDRFSFSGHGKFYAYSLSLINCETPVKQS